MPLPNVPRRDQIFSSNLVVVQPSEHVHEIIERLSTTKCTDMDLGIRPTSHEARTFKQTIQRMRELLAGHAQARNFACLIASEKIKGRLADQNQRAQALQRFRILISDPANWEVIFFTNWKDTNVSQRPRSFHVDGEKYGDLRIGLSNEKQTVFRVGPHSWANPVCPEPVKDVTGKCLAKTVQPPAGTIALWDSKLSAHHTPNISAADLESFGRARHFATASIGFSRTLDRASLSR